MLPTNLIPYMPTTTTKTTITTTTTTTTTTTATTTTTTFFSSKDLLRSRNFYCNCIHIVVCSFYDNILHYSMIRH